MTARARSNNKDDCEVFRARLALRGPPFSLWRILTAHPWVFYEFAPADRLDAQLLERELELKIRRFWSSRDPHEIEELAGELVNLDAELGRRTL